MEQQMTDSVNFIEWNYPQNYPAHLFGAATMLRQMAFICHDFYDTNGFQKFEANYETFQQSMESVDDEAEFIKETDSYGKLHDRLLGVREYIEGEKPTNRVANSPKDLRNLIAVKKAMSDYE